MIFDMDNSNSMMEDILDFPEFVFPVMNYNAIIGDQNVIIGSNSDQSKSIGGSSQGGFD